ncbi:hypothetical protein [Pedobacter puniceum]|uniref:Lipocalin-like domain-containing protein n=1 Tax=Pedobacter puniceum TaxID=2666136 RepID=A0A7K0FJA1_9SPHI|nr:hypothetical protein [Pedobacter puniceum]MRX45978.1 hypothetical protein [Pedobacter puniceum]
MKKIQLLFLMLVTLTASLTFTSCKKDEEPSNQTLLVKKWYYKSYVTSGYSTTAFYADDYWDFKANGTFEETWDWGDGNYTLINDQKTISISFPGPRKAVANMKLGNHVSGVTNGTLASEIRTFEFNITKLTATELEFTYGSGAELQTYKFSTSPNPERAVR